LRSTAAHQGKRNGKSKHRHTNGHTHRHTLQFRYVA
jgi:hypothetical protein